MKTKPKRRKSPPKITKTPEFSETFNEICATDLKEELDKLPFSFDTSENPPFIKVEKSQLDEMKANGWEWLTTDRTINYRPNWDTWYGTREFVQNALDETGDVNLTYDGTKNITFITDNGKGFLTKHLLLGQHKGITEKEKHLTRGCFGEGMKLAALPFFRAGCKIFIRTVGLDITFAMGPFDAYFVHYTFKRKNNHTAGTHIAISNFDGSPYKERFTKYVPKDQILFSKTGGTLKFDENKTRSVFNRPGDVYVRDIFVESLNTSYSKAYFGYNFWFNDNTLVLDPDRTCIKNTDYIRWEFNYILGCKDLEFLTRFFRTISKPSPDLEIDDPKWSFEHRAIKGAYLSFTLEQAETVLAAIKNVIGNKEFTWSNNLTEAKALEHMGITDVSNIIPNLSAPLIYHNLIKSAADWILLRDLKDTIDITPSMVIENFGETAGKNFKAVIKYLSEIAKYHIGSNSEVNFFWAIKSSNEVDRIGGFYTHLNKKISIKITQLSQPFELMDTFIHELGHGLSNGAPDITEEFERGLSLSGRVVADYYARHPGKIKKLKAAFVALCSLTWSNIKLDSDKPNEPELDILFNTKDNKKC